MPRGETGGGAREDLRPDALLVEGARRGDRGDLEALVGRYAEKAWRAAYAVLGNREDAEDAAQEAFVRAIERIDSLREPAAFGGWLLQVVATVALNARAKRKLRTHEELTDATAGRAAVRSGERPDEIAEQRDLRDRFAAALEGLPGAVRASVILCFVEGRNAREAAEILGVAHGTVRSHLHRARRHLRKRLEA